MSDHRGRLKCPNCGAQMEREEHLEQRLSFSQTEPVQSWEYQCPDCDYREIRTRSENTVQFEGIGREEPVEDDYDADSFPPEHSRGSPSSEATDGSSS